MSRSKNCIAFVTTMERQTTHLIKCPMTDNGEHDNAEMGDYCCRKTWRHPYRHLHVLLDGDQFTHWASAAAHVVYNRNRINDSEIVSLARLRHVTSNGSSLILRMCCPHLNYPCPSRLNNFLTERAIGYLAEGESSVPRKAELSSKAHGRETL